MLKHILIWLLAIVVFGGCAYLGTTLMGAGALKRHFTMSGIYAICKPQGYDVVCFSDADGKDGGTNCLPLSLVGGTCH